MLRLSLPRSAFARMGTSVETHLLVADKPLGKTDAGLLSQEARFVVANPSEALDVLREHLPARLAAGRARERANALKASSTLKGTAQTELKAVSAVAQGSMPKRRMLLPASGSINAHARSSTAMVPLKVQVFEDPRANEALSDVYARYEP